MDDSQIIRLVAVTLAIFAPRSGKDVVEQARENATIIGAFVQERGRPRIMAPKENGLGYREAVPADRVPMPTGLLAEAIGQFQPKDHGEER